LSTTTIWWFSYAWDRTARTVSSTSSFRFQVTMTTLISGLAVTASLLILNPSGGEDPGVSRDPAAPDREADHEANGTSPGLVYQVRMKDGPAKHAHEGHDRRQQHASRLIIDQAAVPAGAYPDERKREHEEHREGGQAHLDRDRQVAVV